MKRTAAIAAAGLLLVLTGCSAAPDRTEVMDRFVAEFEQAFGVGDVGDSADDLAASYVDYMFDGKCGDTLIRSSAFSADAPAFRYAFEATCLAYFQGDMSDAQIELAKQVVAEG